MCGFVHRRSIEASAGKVKIQVMGHEIERGGAVGLHFHLTLKFGVADNEEEFKENVIRGDLLGNTATQIVKQH
jgi:hypothetical protein